MDPVIEEIISVNEARQALYRTLASLYFRELTQEQIDAIANQGLIASGEADGELAEGLDDIARFLRRCNTGTRETLAADFAACLLGAGAQGDDVPLPYESIFTSQNGLLMQEASDEVFTAFKHDAVRVKEGLDVPSDHLSFILEYMAVLCERMSAALAAGEVDAARTAFDTQRSFYTAHLASWVFRFLDHFQAGASTRFYRGVAKITRSFLNDDCTCMEELACAFGELAGENENNHG